MSTPKLAADVRKTFLEFFAARGHEIVPSAPLVPQNDPTLMFVNAGMVPFKDVFTGRERRGYARAASSQKCIRISGKHNDLENVGVTARHQTFFEMLGNFSFGDYFKDDAIAWAWELLTRVFEIPTDRLLVTVFDGEGGLPADDEAAAVWRKVTGFGDDRILRLGLADNFWTMGDTGPCGPCSEVHFFHGAEPDVGRFAEEPRVDGSGWTEIWNNVFMQYDRREKDGPLAPLPAPSIDTGMGLERIASVLQGVTSNYDTDLLRALVDKTASIAGKAYRASTADDDVSMRVVADHARTTAFLMAEGVMPDRNKREYVLRRVMRRAIRHGHRLGIDRPFLHEVVLEVVRTMGTDYPELAARRESIARWTEDEEVRFRATLKRGMRILDERFDGMRQEGEKVLAAPAAADLFTTYGFPLDLTEVIAAESGFAVDVEGAEALVKGAVAIDGPIDPAAALDPAFRELAERLGATVFTGYEREEGTSRITGILRVVEEGGAERRSVASSADVGDVVDLAVAATPFYAESGGQVGDVGQASSPTGLTIDIRDVQRPLPGLVVHRGVVTAGLARVGDEIELRVNGRARDATRRNHSATHLLHWALRKVLGDHAQQKGSRVGPDVLRFDFSHNRPLAREEIAAIEDLVNGKILLNAPVVTQVLPIDEAKKHGATMIFEEKYGETVRMLTMTADSIELCGGTHARALGEIGLFKITSESGIASGVRRLFAATGTQALAYVRGLEDEMSRVRQAAKVAGGDVAEKVAKLVANERELQRTISQLERRLLDASVEAGGGGPALPSAADAVNSGARDIAGVQVVARRLPDGTSVSLLREQAEKMRDRLRGEALVVLGSVVAGKAQLVAMVSKSATERIKAPVVVVELAKIVGGAGGGRADMAQAGGADVGRIDEAIAATFDAVARILA